MNSRGYQSVDMERNVIIILILISVFKSDLGFSSGDWFEIDGCHWLGAAIIQNKTNLTENEPGGCLEWCGTKRVALQNSSCFCFNDTQHLNRTREDSCFQNCNGKEEIFKCGGNSSGIVSLYTERSDKFQELGPSNGSRCLTYGHIGGELTYGFLPDTCTEQHPFYCFSETRYDSHECYRHADIHDKRTWYGALEACRSQFNQFLWPAENIICNGEHSPEDRHWVAVYQWTKVLPTSTTTSTTTTTTSIPSTSTATTTTSTPSTTLPTTTITTSTTSTSSTISSTSTTSSSSTVASPTTIVPDSSTTILTSSSSISASTSSSTSTKTTSPTQLPTSSNDTTESPRHDAAIFQIDPSNIGIGVAIGLLVGIVIAITINYVRMRIKGHTSGSTSSESLALQGIQHDEGRQRKQNMTDAFSNGTAYSSSKIEEHGNTKL